MPAIASDGDGDFVVVWQSIQEGAGGSGIYARRYTTAGFSSEIHVNTITADVQGAPAVAMDADGDFVIVWESDVSVDGGIRAQRFNSAGVPQGLEMPVASVGNAPAVAMDAAGNFAITYTVNKKSGNWDVIARQYTSEGISTFSPLLVNTYTTGIQDAPAIAMDADGDFVVTWVSYAQDNGGNGVYAQRFNPGGLPQGAEFRVNSTTQNAQDAPTVAMSADGSFVVAWDSAFHDGSSTGVFAQRHNASGARLGREFQVNTYTSGAQNQPSIAVDPNGDFLIAWASASQDGNLDGIYAKRYDAAGVVQTAEFLINTFTVGAQDLPAVAADHNGNYVVAWASNAQDGSGNGIYAQRYQESVDTAPPIVAGVFVNGQRVLPYTSYAGPMSQLLVTFSENVTDAGLAAGVNSVITPANWLLTRNGVDITADISSITYGFNFATGRYEATINLATSHTSGNFLLKAKDAIRDIVGNRLDGNLDGAAQGHMLLPFSVAGTGPRGNEFLVNTYTTGYQSTPAVAVDGAGNSVIIWQSNTQLGHYGQRYDVTGEPIGGEFRITPPGVAGFNAAIAMNDSGAFVVTWTAGSFGNSEIRAQQFDAAAVVDGPELLVNTFTTGNQENPAIAVDALGNFIIAWHSDGQDGSNTGVYAQRFSATGATRGSEFKVNSYTTGYQWIPTVAMDPHGAFVVAWVGAGSGDTDGVFAQRYDSGGIAQGSEFRVNVYTTGSQTSASVGMDKLGNFVVAWIGRDSSDGTSYANARRYTAAGGSLGSAFRVNAVTFGSSDTVIAVDDDGDFAIAWESNTDIYHRRFTAAGVGVGNDVMANQNSVGFRSHTAIAMDADGDYTVAWRAQGQDGSDYGVYSRMFGVNSTPLIGTAQDTPDPVVAGNSVTFSASGAVDDGTVASVSFYRESNSEPGLQVGAFGDTLVGTANTSVGGFWSASVSTAGLTSGTYTYYAQATDNLGGTGAPVSTSNTVSPPPTPQVTASSFLFQTAPQKLTFTFDRDVSSNLTAGTITVAIQQLPSGTVPATVLTYAPGTNVASFTFNALLADGNYRATVNGAGGTGSVLEFFIVGGDANHDRTVDVNDMYLLAANWLGTSKTFSQGDFNYNGTVDADDLGILTSHWQQTLNAPPPSPALPVSTPVPVRRTAVRVISLIESAL